MLKDATPVGEIYAMHGAKGTTRRYFEEVTMPDGFIIMGDAICSLNPRFGQGMTVVAMQVSAGKTLICWCSWFVASSCTAGHQGVRGPAPQKLDSRHFKQSNLLNWYQLCDFCLLLFYLL